MEIYAKGVFAPGGYSEYMKEIEAFGLCRDFVNLWKHGQRDEKGGGIAICRIPRPRRRRRSRGP